MVVHRFPVRSAWPFLVAVLGAAALLGCNSDPDDRTPAGALRLFVGAMERSDRDVRALEDAYRLLAPEAREALRARAERAESLAGREMAPWDMLVQGRFRLRVPIDGQDALVERIDGDRAVVVVQGDDGVPRAEVPMVREGDRWRVHLDIPPVTRP
jgi:hypothetical protein